MSVGMAKRERASLFDLVSWLSAACGSNKQHLYKLDHPQSSHPLTVSIQCLSMHDFWHFTTYELQQEGYRITQKWSMYLSKKRNCLCVAGYWRTVTSMPNKLDHFPVPMDTLRKCVSHALQTYLWMLGDGKPKQPMLRNRKGICPMEFRF